MKRSELIVNHDLDLATYLSSQSAVSIINLAFDSLELDLLCLWQILKEYPLLLIQEHILFG